MIFIDTVNRLRQLPEKDDPTFLRRRRTAVSNDSLTLSEAATYVQHITLSSNSAMELTPVDSIIANLIETLVQQFEHSDVNVRALSQLAAGAKGWQLPLQTPPLEPIKSAPSDYASELRAGHRKIADKRFEFTLTGRSNHQKKLLLLFRIHHLKSSDVEKFQALSPTQHLSTPYSAEQLDSLPDHWSFEMDQDGESEPLSSLYSEVKDHASYQVSFSGLQIWYEREQDALPLLIADNRYGYIYIGNYGVIQPRRDQQTPSMHHEGDIDTSA